jgi:hypothetical protein
MPAGVGSSQTQVALRARDCTIRWSGCALGVQVGLLGAGNAGRGQAVVDLPGHEAL